MLIIIKKKLKRSYLTQKLVCEINKFDNIYKNQSIETKFVIQFIKYIEGDNKYDKTMNYYLKYGLLKIGLNFLILSSF